MKKVFFGFAILFLLMNIAWTRENSERGNSSNENPQRTEGWNFFAETVFGLRIGKENEIVWDTDSKKGDRYKLSELEWMQTPAIYLSENFMLGHKRLEISLLSKFFMPTKCGIMKDSDWQQDYFYKTGDTSTKTNYSESDNKILKGQDLELMFAIKMYPTSFMTLRPKISVNYCHMDFEATNGTLWYGNDFYKKRYNESGFKGSFYSYDSEYSANGYLPNKPVVGYESHNLYLWTGIQMDFIPTKKLALSIATETAPLVYMISFDRHLLRNLEYKEYSLSLFYAVRQSAAISFNFNKFISLSLNFAAVLTGETLGPSFYRITLKNGNDTSFTREGNAGASTRYLDFGLSAKISW